MPNRKKRILITVVGLCALMAMVLGLFVSQHMQHNKDLSQFHGTLLEKPREVVAFELMGINKKPFNNEQLKGHWTLMFFGFTNCGSICPTTMAELSKMYRLLETKGVQRLPRVVMVSVDPDRDDLNQLARYVKAFNPHFYGIRGDDDALKAITHDIGIAYAKLTPNEASGSDHYDIEHTGTVVLFNPEGKLSAFFTMPHDANQLAEDYLLLAS